MSDIGISMVGCCVFGVVLASTLACFLGPSQQSVGTEKLMKRFPRPQQPDERQEVA